MKIEKASSMQSISTEQVHKNKLDSTFSEYLSFEKGIKNTPKLENTNTLNLRGPSEPMVNIISSDSAPYLSIEEIHFFEHVLFRGNESLNTTNPHTTQIDDGRQTS